MQSIRCKSITLHEKYHRLAIYFVHLSQLSKKTVLTWIRLVIAVYRSGFIAYCPYFHVHNKLSTTYYSGISLHTIHHLMSTNAFSTKSV